MAVLFSNLSFSSLAELREVLKLCLQVAILTPSCYYGSPIIFLNKEGLSKQFLCTAAASCPLLTTRGQYVLSNAPSSPHGRLQRSRDRRQLHTCSSCSQEAPGRMEGRETWPAVFVQLHSPARCIHEVSFITAWHLTGVAIKQPMSISRFSLGAS